MIDLFTQRDCRYAYRELLQGYTHVEKEDFYIKHFKEADLGFVDGVYKLCIDECKEKGLLDKQSKVIFLKENDLWDQDLYDKKVTLELAIKDGYEFARGLGKDKAEEFIEKNVSSHEKEYEDVIKEFDSTLEPVSDTICSKRVNEKYVYYSLFKDKECKTPLYTKQEFWDLSFIEINEIVKIYNYHASKFSEININKISVNPFFLSAFFMCEDDPVKFYGKNILDLTMFQLNLFSRAKFNKTVLAEGREPPEHYYSETEENGLYKLVKWYDGAHGLIMNQRKAQENKRKYNH